MDEVDPTQTTMVATSPARFSAATVIVSGPGSVAELGDQLRRLPGGSAPALVIDHALLGGPVGSAVVEALDGIDVVTLVVETTDPSPSDVDILTAEARRTGRTSVVSVGGGSALGAGKGVALGLSNPGSLGGYAGVDAAPNRPVTNVAIPTTAGSGSEVSSVIVLHDRSTRRSFTARGEGYEPAVAILDGELLRGLPDRPLLFAAFDALSHAVESLWARGASSFTRVLAEAAIREICEALPEVLQTRTVASCQRLLEASTMANLACGPAGLGLVHAIVTASDVVDLPHGYQTGLLLTRLLRFRTEELPAGLDAVTAQVDALTDAVGFPRRFAPGEISAAQAAAMAAAAPNSPFHANDLRAADARTIRELLADVGAGSDTPAA